MGFMDKLKKTAEEAQQNAMQAVDNKMTTMEQDRLMKADRKAQEKEAKADDKARQDELKRIYHPTNNMGDVSIDSANGLFKVRRASADIPKQSGAMAKALKATAAISTLGASVAIEHVMKPDDRIFHFEEIRSFELLEDESQVVGGGVGMALVGGAFFGGAGAIAGSIVGGKKTKKTCDSMILKINLTDIDMPCILIPYITKTVKKTSNDYKKALSDAQQTISCLEMIVEALAARAEANKPKPEPMKVVVEQAQPIQAPATDDPVEKVKKLKELLDMGVLTQEEFDAKKKELLSL